MVKKVKKPAKSSQKTETVNDAFDFVLGVLDPFGNFHLLLTHEQRDLSHLLEVHADRVVQDVQL